jgi:predicted GNAT family acetyltransferase
VAWYDPAARVGELEPVGTHQDHRRQGLGLAVVLGALRALRTAGAEDAVVLSATTNAASEALYAAAGFTAVTRHRAWSRPIP